MRALRWSLAVAGDLLVTAGLVLLLFVAWQLWWTDVTANRAQDATVHSLTREFAAPADPSDPSAPPNEHPGAVPFGDAFAIVRVPRFGADWVRPVLEGTTHDVLEEDEE